MLLITCGDDKKKKYMTRSAKAQSELAYRYYGLYGIGQRPFCESNEWYGKVESGFES